MNKTNDRIMRIGFGAVVFYLTFILFYRTSYAQVGDLYFHCRTADSLGLLRSMSIQEYLVTEEFSHILGYPIWHIICKIFIKIIQVLNPAQQDKLHILSLAGAITNSIFLSVSFQLYIQIFRKFFKGTEKNYTSVFTALALMFAGPLYLKWINPNYYLGQETVAVWHNPTTLAVQPVAVICFFLYWKMATHKEEMAGSFRKIFGRQVSRQTCSFVIFAGLLLFSGLLKPSFYQMFVPALVLYCVADCLLTRFQSFWFCLKTAVAVIPSGLFALWQMQMLSAADSKLDQGNGIAVGLFEVIGEYSPHPVGSLLLGNGFPLFLFVVYRKYLVKNKMLFLALCVWLSGMGQYAFLYKVVNTYAGDFGWGYMLSLLLLFIVAIILLNDLYFSEKNRKLFYIGLFLLGLHVALGLVYYKEVLINLNLYGGITFW